MALAARTPAAAASAASAGTFPVSLALYHKVEGQGQSRKDKRSSNKCSHISSTFLKDSDAYLVDKESQYVGASSLPCHSEESPFPRTHFASYCAERCEAGGCLECEDHKSICADRCEHLRYVGDKMRVFFRNLT